MQKTGEFNLTKTGAQKLLINTLGRRPRHKSICGDEVIIA